MGVEQAERLPAYQVLAEELRAQITSGQLRPGDRLPTEPQLCARSGVSRSTVREALRLLASQHLIITARGVTGGSYVTQPSPTRMAESLSTGVELLMSSGGVGVDHLFEVRETFEVPACGLAARRRTEQQLAVLSGTLFDPDDADVDAKVAAHHEFHIALAAATGNPLFELVTLPLYSFTSSREWLARVPLGFWHRMDADHRQILYSVAGHDTDGARAAARAHLGYLRECARLAGGSALGELDGHLAADDLGGDLVGQRAEYLPGE
jgi:DNA-binding FadR family transcriptional regulator